LSRGFLRRRGTLLRERDEAALGIIVGLAPEQNKEEL
jgi:hypothetical protein